MALTFDLLARDNASRQFRDVGNAADRAGKQTTSFGTSMANSMKMAGAALVGAGLVEGFRNLYNAAAESQKIGRLTEQVIRSTGQAAGVSAKEVGDLAGAIAAKTGVDDEAIQSGQNLLLTFKNIKNEAGSGNDIFNQTTQIMTDMSVALGKDATSSALMLGKALNDPIAGMGALSRAGVQFTAQQKEQIRALVESGDLLGAQKIVLQELSAQFGGAAEAAATPLEKLQVRAGNLAEQLGGYLVPAVDSAATFFGDKLMPILEDGGALLNATVVPAFKFLADAVGLAADVWNGLPGAVQAGVVALGAFVTLRGPLSTAFETIALRALYMKDAVLNAGGGLNGLKTAGSGLLGFLGGPWGIAIAGATAGLTLFTSWMGKSAATTEETQQAQRDLASALRESKGALDDNVRAAAAKAAQDADLLDVAENAGISLNRVTDAVLGNRAAYQEVTAAMDAYLQTRLNAANGNTEDAGFVGTMEAANGFKASLDELAPTVARTREEQGQLASATEQTANASDNAAASQQTFAQATEAARDQVNEAKQAVDDFKLALDILSGDTVSLIQVESAFQNAVAEASGALEGMNGTVLDGAGNLNLQSESGRRAADVLLDVRNSGNDLIATLQAQGATSEQVRARDAELRASFINTANQMGITGQDAERLADQILGIPSERTTAINADTFNATNAINRVQQLIDGLRGRTVEIGVRVAGGTNSVFASMGSTFEATGSIIGARPMSSSVAKVVPPGTLRVIGDNPVADEAFIPLNRSPRSQKILGEAASRMGYGLMPMAVGGINLTSFFNTLQADNEISAIKSRLQQMLSGGGAAGGGPAGGGAIGGGWQSIWNYIKARVPQARQNSTFRPGDPGYHGRGKAIDFGFGSGPGGPGNAGLALINRLLHDGVGRNLAELIYNGVGDDRPNLKNGKPLAYSASVQAQHRNHVHAAVYDGGGLLPPGLTLAYNATGKNETIRTAEQEAALHRPAQFTGSLYLDSGTFLGVVRGEMTSREAELDRNLRSAR